MVEPEQSYKVEKQRKIWEEGIEDQIDTGKREKREGFKENRQHERKREIPNLNYQINDSNI